MTRRTFFALIGFAIFAIMMFLGQEIIGPTICYDGWHSSSIGHQGACSHHGGVNNTPGTIVLFLSIGIGVGSYTALRDKWGGKN